MEEILDIGKIIYLDNAATTYPKPREVLDAMVEHYALYGVNPGRSGYDLCVLEGDMVNRTRKEMAEFFGGDNPDHLIFAANATDALNLIILGILEDGGHAVTTNIEHNSVIRPLNHLREKKIIELDYVPVGGDCLVDPQEISKRIRRDTKLVVVNHGSNVVGTIQPAAEIGRICRERGVYFVIDSAQTAGVIPIDIEEMCIDAIAFTGHKSLLGPTGTGGLYVREGVEIKATRYGGTGVKSAYPFHLDEFPYRLEAGTGNVMGIAGLHFAQKYLAKRGLENIYKHEMKLFERLQNGLMQIEGVTLHGTTSLEHRLPVLNFNVHGLDAADVGTILDVDFNIATRTGLHCAPLIHDHMGTSPRGSVRLSVGPMNEAKDVEAAVEAVAEIAKDALNRR
jgi:cysteine desulfurase/selenocysteine lyase